MPTCSKMSGTTQLALVVVALTFGGALIVALLTARFQRRNARRAAHEPAVGAARLIKREMDQINADARALLEEGHADGDFPTAEWDQNKAAVASRLSEEELLVLDRFYAVARGGSAAGVAALHSTASQAVSWLARGKSNVVKPRKTEVSLAPANMDLPCRCGHIFGHHGWRAVRRRVRLRHRHAKFKDVGFECKRCTCKRFRGVGRLDYM